ncbi:ArsR/SmtB family transcription factor [Amycolatopsis suaedae]|uniref:Metalloregulator ArsR/SmtB family transcription factor n=1 Tax=Amycolatopsis suaedae TaxID=2510978 RepID=A0A4Q7J9Y5_9PSEU|nr:metalloregulator ArsR/SmtB family transcription factor [Amycolatopsis suaedae]RZQ62974.1 metalloregulator ArsR/SmtB family transcription factor [Amycolatopsis suaedae]
MDEVFKALADPSRRRLLDSLNARNGQSLRELCSELDMARQSVSKHLAVLIDAGVVTTVRRGREKLHYLNAEPINAIADRWIHRYDRGRVHALADLKTALEHHPMSSPEFVYTTYIRTTPETLWRALTEPAFTLRYWGAELKSDWQPGSPLLWRTGADGPLEDLGQVVLEADPPRRLAYTWHGFQPDHAEFFGWSQEKLAEAQKERRSKVSFDITPHGENAVRLRVTHDDFDPGGMMYEAISGNLPPSGGWPELLADLKTLLETDKATV